MIDRRKVYVWKWAGEKEFQGIALDVHMFENNQDGRRELRFDDTVHGHMIPGEIVKETENGFLFRSDGFKPGEWEFKELTIEAFKRKYYKIVGNGEVIASVIKTTEDLHEWYRKEFGF